MIHCLRSLNCTHLVHGWMSKIEDDCKKKIMQTHSNFIYLANIHNTLTDIKHSFHSYLWLWFIPVLSSYAIENHLP